MVNSDPVSRPSSTDEYFAKQRQIADQLESQPKSYIELKGVKTCHLEMVLKNNVTAYIELLSWGAYQLYTLQDNCTISTILVKLYPSFLTLPPECIQYFSLIMLESYKTQHKMRKGQHFDSIHHLFDNLFADYLQEGVKCVPALIYFSQIILANRVYFERLIAQAEQFCIAKILKEGLESSLNSPSCLLKIVDTLLQKQYRLCFSLSVDDNRTIKVLFAQKAALFCQGELSLATKLELLIKIIFKSGHADFKDILSHALCMYHFVTSYLTLEEQGLSSDKYVPLTDGALVPYSLKDLKNNYAFLKDPRSRLIISCILYVNTISIKDKDLPCYLGLIHLYHFYRDQDIERNAAFQYTTCCFNPQLIGDNSGFHYDIKQLECFAHTPAG